MIAPGAPQHGDRWPEMAAAAVAAAQQGVPPAMAAAKVGPGEYTVAACICVVYPDGAAAPVAVGLGTRCLGPDQSRDHDGAAVVDCHAEVLARRAFVRLLALEAAWLLGADGVGCARRGAVLELAEAGAASPLQLRAGAHVVLWVSKAPCGDAAVMLPGGADHLWHGGGAPDPTAKRHKQSADPVAEAKAEAALPGAPRDAVPRAGWSGAKPVVELASPAEAARATAAASRRGSASGFTSMPCDPMCGEDGLRQRGGLVRTKAGRSDLPAGRRCRSLSCSDKLCRWRLVGLQGAVLAAVVGHVPLSGVVVSVSHERGPARLALSRALCGRVAAAKACLRAAAGSEVAAAGGAEPKDGANAGLAGAAHWALGFDEAALDSELGTAAMRWVALSGASGDAVEAFCDADGGVALTGWQPEGTREQSEEAPSTPGHAAAARSPADVIGRAEKRGRDTALSVGTAPVRSWGSGVAEMCLGRWPAMLAEASLASAAASKDACGPRLRWSLRDLVAKKPPAGPTAQLDSVALPLPKWMQGRGTASNGRGEVISSGGTLQGRKASAPPDDLAPAVAPRRLTVLLERVCSLAGVASTPKDGMVARLAWDVTTAATPAAQALAVPRSGFEGWLRGRTPQV